ncbi:MAG: cytochrome c biogenesis protein ResB [Nitrospirota bacterium]
MGSIVWKFLRSLRLAIVLILVLALASIIGTLIEQNQPPDYYVQEYGQRAADFFALLGFFDLYHAWWYVLFLLLLAVNLIVCSLDRFPSTWKLLRAPLAPLDDECLKTVLVKQEIVFSGTHDEAEQRTRKLLAAHGYSTAEFKKEKETDFAGQKGGLSRLGVFVTHAGILLILCGALIGTLFGYTGVLPLAEQEYSGSIFLQREPLFPRIMSSLGMQKSSTVPDAENGLTMPLDFYVFCNQFEILYYQDQSGPSRMPSEYASQISILNQKGEKLAQKRITVNDPLTYRGITFYQSGYGRIPHAQGAIELAVRSKKEPSQSEHVVIEPGAAVYVPLIKRTIKVLSTSPYAARNTKSGDVVFYRVAHGEMINPAVELALYKGKTVQYKTIVMKTDQGTPFMPEDYTIEYVHTWGMHYTVLQVKKDPGIGVVYAGFILICIGPLLALFGSHKKIWIKIQNNDNGVSVIIAGTAHRNKTAFETECARLVNEFKGTITGG